MSARGKGKASPASRAVAPGVGSRHSRSKGITSFAIPDRRCVPLVVVGRFLSQPTDTSTGVRRILTEHQVQLYTEDTLSKLIDEIRRTGKVLQPD